MDDVNENPSVDEEEKPQPDLKIEIKVAAQDGREVFFKTRRNTPMSKLMTAYCGRTGTDITSVRFLHDGIRVNADDTAESLDMQNEDVLDAVLQQTGGY